MFVHALNAFTRGFSVRRKAGGESVVPHTHGKEGSGDGDTHGKEGSGDGDGILLDL